MFKLSSVFSVDSLITTQEKKQLQDQVKSAVHNVTVEVQCQMADQAHDILMGKFSKS